MVDNEQILKDILLKMNYDSSKTLNENIQEQQFNIPDRTMQSDNTRVDPQYLGLQPMDREGNVITTTDYTYNGKTKPDKPKQETIVSRKGSPIDYSKVRFEVKYTSPRLEKLVKDNKSCYKTLFGGVSCLGRNQITKAYKEDYKDWDVVDWESVLTTIEISAMLMAMLATGPAGLILYGVGIAAGVGAAKLVYDRGDEHSAAMLFALTVIPEGKLIGKGITYLYKKFGKKAATEMISQYSKGILKGSKKDLVEKAYKDFVANSKKYTSLLKVSVKDKIKTSIKNMPLQKSLLFLNGLVKFVGNVTIMVGGTYYAADKLWLYYKGDDEYRQKSEMRAIADMVVKFGEAAINKAIGKTINEVIDKLPDEDIEKLTQLVSKVELDFNKQRRALTPKDQKLQENNLTKLTKIFGNPIDTTIKNGNRFRVGTDIITFYNNGRYYVNSSKPEKKGNWEFVGNSSVTLDGKRYDGKFTWKQNNLTIEDIKNGKGVVKFGDKGEIVKYIQTELANFHYKGINNEVVDDDGKFGKNTKFALEKYQDDYGINDDGTFGKETLSAFTDI